MRRAALLLILASVATALPATVSHAGFATADEYRSRFVATDRDGRPYVVDALVEDFAGGRQLTIEIRRRCPSCRADVYAKTLEPGEFRVQPTSMGAECQCFSATVDTKFGRKPLEIGWVWDPEQGGGAAGDGFEWTAVTGNNLLNVSCFGSGSHTSTPDLFSGAAPERPAGAKDFPQKVPPRFQPSGFRMPGCHTEAP